jgi:hypothetical protein
VTARAEGPNNAFRPRGSLKPWTKAWRPVGSPTPDAAAWGHSPDVPVWRDVIHC